MFKNALLIIENRCITIAIGLNLNIGNAKTKVIIKRI
jgi:hypothetical protein